MHTDNMHTS